MSISNVSYTITGDCQSTNSGGFTLSVTGTAPDYRVEFLNPPLSTIFFAPFATTQDVTGLSGGVYTMLIKDSALPTNNIFTLSLFVSTGTCSSISATTNTLCSQNNGSLTAVTTYSFTPNQIFNLYDDNDVLLETKNGLGSAIFSNLSAGTYYVVSDDGGGCSGKSETCIINPSTSLNYSLYVVNNSACVNNLGKVFVSGLTGTYPFSYSWSNGQTGNTITGLTTGAYSVTITDGSGCVQTQTAIVDNADPLAVVGITSFNPTCTGNDGQIVITISGGSPPYYFSASNGDTQFTFDDEGIFDNLNSGNYSFTITDAGLCTTTTATNLLPAGGFSLIGLTTTNSNCLGNGGQIQVSLFGAPSTYTYYLAGSNNNVIQTSVTSLNYTFSNLTSDTYNLIVSSNTSNCVYTNTLTITSSPTFTFSVSTTDTTCGFPNGQIELNISSGAVFPYTFELNGVVTPPTTLSTTGATFTNLAAGNYTIELSDFVNCSYISTTNVGTSQSVDFVLTNTTTEISVYVTQGVPPFTFEWYESNQLLSETGTTLTSVTPGTYFVIVTDSTGCKKTSQQVIIQDIVLTTKSSQYNVCSSPFQKTIDIKQGILQMFFEGFRDLIQNETRCILDNAIFTSLVTVSGTTYTDTFYTATTIYDLPTDNLYYGSIRNVLLSVYGIGGVDIDPLNNLITISTDCNLPANILAGAEINLDLSIEYDISCKYCTFLFSDCCGVLPDINVGILDANFGPSDIIVYNGNCYEFTNINGNGSPVILKENPDFLIGQCASCRVSVSLPAAC